MAANIEDKFEDKFEDEGGGWTFKFVEDVDEDFTCIICLLPMKESQQISKCGHAMCKICLDKVICSDALCPSDRQPIKRSDIFPDLKCDRRIMALKVKCENIGCEWIGELVDLIKKHLNDCPWGAVCCSNKECSHTSLRKDIKWHVENECSWRIVQCKYCNKDCIICETEEHFLNDCLEYPIECKCGTINQRKMLESHLQECPCRLVECQYYEVGCSEKVMVKNMELHVKSNLQNHMGQLLVYARQSIDNLTKDNKILEVNMENLVKENQNLRTDTDNLTKENKTLEVNMENLVKENQNLRTDTNNLGNDTLCIRNSLQMMELENQELKGNLKKLKEQKHQRNLFFSALFVLGCCVIYGTYRNVSSSEDIRKLQEKHHDIERTLNNRTFEETAKEFMNQTGEEMLDFRKELGSVTSKMHYNDNLLKLKMEHFDFDPNYVEFIWQIDNFEMHLNRSKKDRLYEIHSPVYQTGAKGYHFRLDANLDYVDISIRIIQGPYDDILPWPPKLSREITLINLDKQKNIIKKMNYWHYLYPKPQKFEGKRDGIRFLVNTAHLTHGYVINNNVFIKLKLPKFSFTKKKKAN